MTGHIGARTNRAVALVTDDFRRYHVLAPFFEEQGITLLGLSPNEPVPGAVRAVIGGEASDPRHVPLHDDVEAVWLAVMAALDPRRDGAYRRIVVGIDPGATVGMAILADGALFWVRECRSAEEVAGRIAAWHPALQAMQWDIHVGDGAPRMGEALANTLRARFPSMRLAFVREDASSPVAPVTLSRHTDAAIHIAMREAP